MGQNSQQTFGIFPRITGGAQRRTQTAFSLGDGTFHVPPTPVNSLMKSPFHLSSITSFGPCLPGPASVELDHRTTNAQFLAGQTMVVFSVVTGITDQSIDGAVPPYMTVRIAH